MMMMMMIPRIRMIRRMLGACFANESASNN